MVGAEGHACPRRVAVIGGGIAGLSAALTLHESAMSVTVIEASDRLGGKILTERTDGYTIEAGPDSILSSKPAGLSMIERIGRLDYVVNTREDGQGTHILHRGKLERLPEGMAALVPIDVRSVLGTRLLSWRGKLRLGREYLLPAQHGSDDESVGDFVRRRLGDEFFENMAEPLLSGIYAGDADQLSLLATFPRLRFAEQQHGGLIRGAIAQRRARQGSASNETRWTPFISLERGLGEIVEGLATSLAGTDIRLGVQAVAVHRSDSGFQIELSTGERLHADGIVLAIPAWATADLLRSVAPRLARELDAIQYVSTATISMAFATQVVP
ncbi:MAG: protoporphyrinogen oxidase, partial [Thermomicrobiales bacterium]